MPTRVVRVFLLLLLLAGGNSLWAQANEKKGTWTFTVEDLRTFWFGIVPSGADIALQYRGLVFMPGLETIFENDTGAGYQENVFFRNLDDSPYTGPTDNGTTFAQTEVVDDFGLKQGILWNPELNQNLLEAFVFYRFHYDYDYRDPTQTQLVFASPFPDNVQTLINAVYGGFDYDTTVKDKIHRTWTGQYVETSLEWGPRSFLNSMGDSDYYRLNFTTYGFHTFYTSEGKNGFNRFSIYGGDFFAVDYAGGSSIPIYVMQTIGGRYYRNGVGDAVRAFEAGAYDTNFKAVNNLEIRATGPAVIWRDLVPGVYAFVDSGYYDGYFSAPAPSATSSGFLASTGVGGYVDFFGLANATIYLGFPIYGHRVDNAPYALELHFHLQM